MRGAQSRIPLTTRNPAGLSVEELDLVLTSCVGKEKMNKQIEECEDVETNELYLLNSNRTQGAAPVRRLGDLIRVLGGV